MDKKHPATRSIADNQIITKEIKKWRDFSEVVAGQEYRNWAIRGQTEAAWPL